MQISGLVVLLERDERAAADAYAALRAAADLELGEAPLDARRVPAVLEASSPRASKERLRWIESRPGVVRVEVAFVALPSDATFEE